MNLEKVKDFVREKTLSNGRPPKYPFRNRFEHTIRVYNWAMKLQEKEGGDREIIALMSLLHDVGWADKRSHGEVGAEIAEKYLNSMNYDKQKIKRIVDIIKIHSNKDTTEKLNIEEQIFMDADLLDELGAISIIWVTKLLQ